MSSSPAVVLHADSVKLLGILSLPLSLCPSPAHVLPLSLKINLIKKKYQCQIGILFAAFGRPLEVNLQALGILNKALPPSVESYSSVEKQLLACYRALVETECLTVYHQVTKQPKLPVTN